MSCARPCLCSWFGWHLDEPAPLLRADRKIMCSASSFTLNLVNPVLRLTETIDIVILEKEEGAAASFLALRSNSLSQLGLGKLFISSLSEAVMVTWWL